MGQTVVIENRPGAGGVIAEQALVQSPPDGYTLIVVASGHALLSHFYNKLPYDTFKDFTPISLIGSSPNMLLVRADSPFKTVGDVIAAARAKPGQLSYGHAGIGTSPYLSGELFKYMAKIEITAVPYKGGAPALADLIGGHIPLTFNNIPESLGQIQAGTVRPLGVTTAARSPVLPDIPAIAETVARLRHRRVVGVSGAGRIARRRKGKTRQGLRRGRPRPPRWREALQARRRPDRLVVGGVRQAHSRRLRQMGTGHQSRRHQVRIIRSCYAQLAKLSPVPVPAGVR